MWTFSLNRAVYPMVVLLLVGCATSRPLMPTPAIYTDQKESPYEDVPVALRTPEVEVLYATDREREQETPDNTRYGYGRSASVAFGRVVVDLGHDLTWEELVKQSQVSKRDRPMRVSVSAVEEIGRFPPTPAPYRVVDEAIIVDKDYRAEEEHAVGQFQDEIRRRLALTQRKEVFLYVHGFRNSFDIATYVAAELWHFLGREGVPILYTWPAGRPGLFGYTYDRESSEYTVFHLKQILSAISAMPEVEAIHLVAHSRGTDVATAAIRELFIFARGAGLHPRAQYKIQNLVLAAPDLDVGVVQQRLTAEQLDHGFDTVTLYFSPADGALGIAQWLFDSPRGRLGTMDEAELSAQGWDTAEQLNVLEERNVLVRFDEGISDKYRHSYFRTNPSVSSDIVLLLRYGLPPGSPERPLENIGPGLWRIPPGYPNVGE